jgi:hypothetical protein
MNILTGFTESPRQSTTIVLDDGTFATLDLVFRSQQLGWFYDLTYNTITILGQRLVYSENMLRQFIGQLPFGLAVLSETRNDPRSQSDLAKRSVVIVLLNPEDVQAVELSQYTRR